MECQFHIKIVIKSVWSVLNDERVGLIDKISSRDPRRQQT